METESRDERKRKQDENWKQKVVIQIECSYESHIFICSIQCNFNNDLLKSDYMKLDPDTEMETEAESRDEWKRKWDENWKQKVVIQIDSSYESNIFICFIQCNFNDVLPTSDFIKFEPDMETETEIETETETETETGRKMEMETCDTN